MKDTDSIRIQCYQQRWFIIRTPAGDTTCGKHDTYLHDDGQWRPTVIGADGKESGYFDTQGAAEAVLSAWQQSQLAEVA